VLIGLLFAVLAMVLNTGAGLLQAAGSRRVSRRRPLIVQPRFIGGLLADAVGWAATVVALRQLPVFAVQAVLGGTIALTPVATRIVHGSSLRRVDRYAIAACSLGLALAAGSAGSERHPVSIVTAAAVLFTALGLLVVALVALWHGGRAWPLAIVAGLGFGGSALAVRSIDIEADRGVLLQLAGQPATYLVITFWVLGLVAYSRALGLATLASVTAVFLVTEVVAPGLIGIALLGDTVRDGWWPVLVAGLAVAMVGVVVVARSPAQEPPPARVR
jgi:hypothetical protein